MSKGVKVQGVCVSQMSAYCMQQHLLSLQCVVKYVFVKGFVHRWDDVNCVKRLSPTDVSRDHRSLPVGSKVRQRETNIFIRRSPAFFPPTISHTADTQTGVCWQKRFCQHIPLFPNTTVFVTFPPVHILNLILCSLLRQETRSQPTWLGALTQRCVAPPGSRLRTGGNSMKVRHCSGNHTLNIVFTTLIWGFSSCVCFLL